MSVAGAIVSDWLLLLALFAGACCVIACSPSSTLANCHCFSANSRNSLQCDCRFAHDVESVSNTRFICCRTPRARVIFDAHKVLFLYRYWLASRIRAYLLGFGVLISIIFSLFVCDYYICQLLSRFRLNFVGM